MAAAAASPAHAFSDTPAPCGPTPEPHARGLRARELFPERTGFSRDDEVSLNSWPGRNEPRTTRRINTKVPHGPGRYLPVLTRVLDSLSELRRALPDLDWHVLHTPPVRPPPPSRRFGLSEVVRCGGERSGGGAACGLAAAGRSAVASSGRVW